MKLIQFNLPESTYKRLRDHAEQYDLTMSQILRHLVAVYLAQPKYPSPFSLNAQIIEKEQAKAG